MDPGALQQDTTTCCHDSNLAGELMMWTIWTLHLCVCMCFRWSARQCNHSFCDSRLLDAAYCCVSTCAPRQCRFFAAIFLDHHIWSMPKRSNLALVLAQLSLGMVDLGSTWRHTAYGRNCRSRKRPARDGRMECWWIPKLTASRCLGLF